MNKRWDGWALVEADTPRRRTRGSNASVVIEKGQLRLTAGDAVETQSGFCVILAIEPNVREITVKACCFEKQKNELVITSRFQHIKLSSVVRKVEIPEDFACVSCNVGDRVEPFDYENWRQVLKKSESEAVSLLKGTRPKRRYISESDSGSAEEHEPESETESESEPELEAEKPRKRRSPQKPKLSQPKSPRKPKTPTKKSPAKQKPPPEMLAALSSKHFKIKSTATAKTLPSLAIDKPKGQIDATLEAFKELKEKLHTAAKVASLPCREDEYTTLLLKLEELVRTGQLGAIYVSGMPGVGKTATVREVVKLMEQLSDEGVLRAFAFHELNCLKLLDSGAAYEQLWFALTGIKVTLANAGLLLEDYFKKGTPQPLILLLDELDQLVQRTQTVMYNMLNWTLYPRSQLVVVAVANTMDLPERVLNNKLTLRLGLERVQFVGYTFDELGVIIAHRLEKLTEQSKRQVSITADAVGFASRKVASVSGDARRALTICRRAVEIAELDGATEVHISHILRAIAEAVALPAAQLVASLLFVARFLVAALIRRTRRTGVAEHPFGDVMEEMRHAQAAADVQLVRRGEVRIDEIARVVNELAELGVVTMAAVRSERHRTVSLAATEQELVSWLGDAASIL